ncbi:glycosyltransferase, partial [Synergistaceae bacterium OttesenSCG-928-I11]|nr:glycosyltransferase [Synergistaceae bacterium OttesenSCG-928-I11]
MSPLISIVIPSYNAAGKIESTLESALKQDYEAIEVIVVDDASSDDTGDVVRNILQTARFAWRVETHEKNRGVSAARNTGMSVAQGEYVVFVDADDLLEKEYISGLCAAVCAKDGDLAFCGHKVYDEGTGETVLHSIRLPVDMNRDAQDYVVMLLTKKFHAGIWSTIFRRRFLEENALSFYEGCSAGEDVEFV